jgi:site-specific DNA-methyltransferase (adenine-specific)
MEIQVSVIVRQGDMREIVKTLPDAAFDCLMVDPPYGETSLAWDRWPIGWPSMLLRLVKPSGSMWVFGSMRMFLTRAAEFEGWRLSQDVVWEKQNGSGFHADRFKRVHEFALHFYPATSMWRDVYREPQFTNDATARTVRRKTRPTHINHIEHNAYKSINKNPHLIHNIIQTHNEHGRAEHPTQKPLDLVLPLLRYACPVGGHVLDPFAGSGTVGVAANEIGAHATLIEADPEYIEVINRRIASDAPLLRKA